MLDLISYLISVIFGHRFRPHVLMHASGAGACAVINNIAGYSRIDERIALFLAHCSECHRSSLKNIKKDRKIPVMKEGSGKNREEGEKLLELKGPAMVEDARKIVEEHDIHYIQCNNTAGGGTSGKSELYMATEIMSQGVLDSVVLQTILPSYKEDPIIIENAVECIQETAKRVDAGDISNWILIQNGKIAKNDTGSFKNTDLNIARVEEIILRSLITPGNPLDVSSYFRYVLESKSAKYRISTKGYAQRRLKKRHNGAFVNEDLKDITTKAITENWLGADLNEQCLRAYIVLRADPKFINDNNLTLIQDVAQKLLPKTAVIIARYPVKRAQTLEIAGLFVGIKMNILQEYIQRLDKTASETETEDEENPSNPIDLKPETAQLPQTDTHIPKTLLIQSYATVKADILDSMAIHALSYLEPVTRECYGTIYADNEGKLVKYHPIDSEEHTLRDKNAVKFTEEFYEHVRRLSKLHEDIGLRLAGDNHSHPGGVPMQSNADMDFNKSFWKTARNTCFITAIGHGEGNKEWEIQEDGLEAIKEISGKLIRIRAYAGGENTVKKLKIV